VGAWSRRDAPALADREAPLTRRRWLRPAVSDARAVGGRVTSDPVNDDRDTVKLRSRFACSKHSAGPQLLIRKVRNVGLAVPGIYEDPVLVDHGSLPSRARAQGEHEPAHDLREQLPRRALAVIERCRHAPLATTSPPPQSFRTLA
jgi:hypothetical protein